LKCPSYQGTSFGWRQGKMSYEWGAGRMNPETSSGLPEIQFRPAPFWCVSNSWKRLSEALPENEMAWRIERSEGKWIWLSKKLLSVVSVRITVKFSKKLVSASYCFILCFEIAEFFGKQIKESEVRIFDRLKTKGENVEEFRLQSYLMQLRECKRRKNFANLRIKRWSSKRNFSSTDH